MLKNDKTFFIKLLSIVFFILFLIFFGYKIGINTFFWFGIEKHLPDIFGYKNEKNYNALLLNKGSDASFISLEEIDIENAKVLELLGDTSYVRQGSQDSTIAYYNNALLFEKNDRIEEKIRLLSTGEGADKKDEKEGDGSGESIPLIEDAKKRIEEDAKSRGIYIRPSSLLPENTLDAKIFFEERIDW